MVGGVRALFLIFVIVFAGCSRSHYRSRADVDAYSLIHEKAGHTPWDVESTYDLVAKPGSRLFDPTPLDDPLLPYPSPQLYAYDLPRFPARDPSRFRPQSQLPPVPADFSRLNPPVQVANHAARIPVEYWPDHSILATRYQDLADREPGDDVQPPPELPAPRAGDQPALESETSTAAIPVVPISPEAWESVPRSCLVRMFEFSSLREEFQRSFHREPNAAERDSSPALTLEDIVEMALLNSREYQTQKETLYRVALQLSLQRFDYDLKFSTGGNRTAVNYEHDRRGGITVNSLNVPTSVQADKMLATGGTLLGRFANSVVLTFNGPNGFAADVGSELLLDVTHSVFQRDIRFERLTQAERDLVYTARDYARFRKTIFTQLAAQYYSLIRTYRQVEIDSQNYFTLVRAFRQSEEEYRAQQVARFQVDQVEQNVLRGRSRLIVTCNNLEAALDNLKLRMGVPTESPINIDLTELEQLTLRDELAVTRELIRRVQQRMIGERNESAPEYAVLLSSAVVLIERIVEGGEVLERIGQEAPNMRALQDLRGRLLIDAERSEVRFIREVLEQKLRSDPHPSATFLGTMDLVGEIFELLDRQLELVEHRQLANPAITEVRQRLVQARTQAAQLTAEYRRLMESLGPAGIPAIVANATQLRAACESLVQVLNGELGLSSTEQSPDADLRAALATVDQLVAYTQDVDEQLGGGLVPIEIELDDAMLTALVLRMDLMNERGNLADEWRQIKLAGDDLKSILNLRATQSVRTRSDVNRVFDFTFDDSTTQLNATLDLPLNRRAQRNFYRQSLINYQAAMRRLMQLEDNVKFSVRNDLRDLSLDKEQYRIDVASAALAYERVVSTDLEFRLGVGNVQARDFLEAQDAYISALSSVAARHIGYIVNRTNLFFNMELLEVDESGFWPLLYDEPAQPTPFYQLPDYAFPFYGELPHGLKYSAAIRRMEHIPPGTSMIHGSPTTSEPLSEPEELGEPGTVTTD